MNAIGIQAIGVAIPDHFVDNLTRCEELDVDPKLIEGKIGFTRVCRDSADGSTSGLCIKAMKDLQRQTTIDLSSIECVVLVTQNPDGGGIPHASAAVHGELGLSSNCAVFDISLGCSGYVYALSIATSFMQSNGMNNGLVFTADPYSRIIDQFDRNTSLIFADAATATLLSNTPVWSIGSFDFGSDGRKRECIQIGSSGRLEMNGRQVFNFCATKVPKSIRTTIEKNGLTLDDIDRFLVHQGSKYIVDTIGARLGVEKKTPFFAEEYGNTVSSSIPIGIAHSLKASDQFVVISGFGVGLSWASNVIRRTSSV